MKKVLVRYLIGTIPHSVEFESIGEADAFVISLLEIYGDENISTITIEKEE